MKAIILVLSILAFTTTFGQDLCKENFDLISSYTGEASDTVRPARFDKIKTVINRKGDVIKFKLTFDPAEESKSGTFKMHRKNCDTLILGQKSIMFYGLFTGPVPEDGGKPETLLVHIFLLHSKKELLVMNDKREMVFIRLDN